MYAGEVETGVPFTGHSLDSLTNGVLYLTGHFM